MDKFKYNFFFVWLQISLLFIIYALHFFFLWLSKILKFKESKQEVDISFFVFFFLLGT